ncbi:MAG TPA: tetratricopeptide repeat protein [Gemmataceae bacterium]|nr:tetratricopeptide repeat protein [Gemmataceae bacterium]
MARLRFPLFGGWILVAWIGVVGSIPAADEDMALRRKALALNDVTGEKPILGEIKTLLKDPTETRKLLREAVALAKQKEQPFNYNGAFILGKTALLLKELDTSKVFFQICADQASKLQSAQKLGEAYLNILDIIDLYYEAKKYPESLRLAQEWLEVLDRQGVRSESKAEVLRVMSRALFKQGKVEQANKVAEDLLKARDSSWRNYELKAWLQGESGHTDEALKTYEKVLTRIDDDEDLEKEDKVAYQEVIRTSMIRLLVKAGKVDEASRVMEDILKDKKDDLTKLELKGRLQQMIGHYSGAAKTYEDLLERIAKDEKLKDEQKSRLEEGFRYILSNVYVELNRIDKATEQLKMLLEKQPDSPRYNNDLGYVWADHDKDLNEAEKLIRKALEEDRKQRKARPDLTPDEDKDSAAYLDSLGWVLFKQKKYPEAKKCLLDAIKGEEGENIEIYDHLADVHMALGEKAEALDIWKKALKLETNSLREQQRRAEIEKKLKANE